MSRVLPVVGLALLLTAVLSPRNTAAQAADGADAGEAVSLAGEWKFKLDADDKGVAEKWFDAALPETIKLPGTTDQAGFGRKTTERLTSWLTRVHEHVGPAWYQREIEIPATWKGKRITLFLERCHWETQAWVDGKPAGMQDSLCTPHEYDLTKLLTPGKHALCIRVDNRMKINVGKDAHSISEHTQTNWNGIVGRIELRKTDPVWIEDVQAHPDVAGRKARVVVTIGNATGQPAEAILLAAVTPRNTAGQVVSNVKQAATVSKEPRTNVEIALPLGAESALWDEFDPAYYSGSVFLSAADQESKYYHAAPLAFGLREFKTKGTQFTINGRLVFLRGTLECCIFPLTGYPPTDVASWRRVLSVAKSFGLNHLRFHSYCPPEAAFKAADAEGVYFHVETPVWTVLGERPEIDAFIHAEADRILKCYGNHPSFCMLCVGNEPSGKQQGAFLSKIVADWKSRDSRRVYTGCSGWPITPEADYHSRPQPRAHAWAGSLISRFNSQPLSTETDYRKEVASFKAPVVTHEMGQWCVYPNFDEMAKYTGVVRARNFELAKESLEAHKMLDQAKDFLVNSGKWQALLYKEEMETALRTKGFGGFQLLDLHDFPGQGTALVGVLDAFWGEKGYLTAAEHRRYCCETVPLMRVPKVVYTNDEQLRGSLEVAHYGKKPLENAVVEWTLSSRDGVKIAAGKLPAQTIPLGSGNTLGEFEVALDKVNAPSQLTLSVAIAKTPYQNAWPIWVFAKECDTAAPKGVTVVNQLDDAAITALKGGGRVVLLASAETINSTVPPGFTTIFWNTEWTKRQPPHTLGTLCDPKHAALKEFPTESHCNWQWFDLVSKGRSMILDDLPAEVRPIVQVIDDWKTNRRLGLAFEAKVAGGKLLVVSMDLNTDLSNRPVARQMRRSLLQYAGSDAFAPKHEVELAAIRKLFKE